MIKNHLHKPKSLSEFKERSIKLKRKIQVGERFILIFFLIALFLFIISVLAIVAGLVGGSFWALTGEHLL